MKNLLCVSIALLAIAGCKKKEVTVGLESGYWKQQTVYGSSYLSFRGNGTLAMYTKVLYNLHVKQNGHYSSTNSQIEMSSSPGASVELSNYHISNDTLYIERGSSTDVYVKTNEALDTANWVQQVQVSEKYDLGARHFGAIDYNGADIYMVGYSNYAAYRISTATHTIIDSILPSFNGKAVACVSSDLWLAKSSTKEFNKMNYATNTIAATSPAASPSVGPATGYGSKIMFLDGNSSLQTYDPATSTYQTLFTFTNFPVAELAFDIHAKDNLVYIASYLGLLVFDLNTHEFTHTYGGLVLIGITEVNGELWGEGFDQSDIGSLNPGGSTYLFHLSLN